MTNMMRPTDNVTDSLRALNVKLYDAEGNMKSLPDILAQLEQSLYKSNDAWIEVGGRTKEQNEELKRLQKAYGRTQRSIADYETGVKGAGLTEEKRAEKIATLKKQLENTGVVIASLENISGDYVKVQRQLTEEERNRYIQIIAGTYGMKAMNTLLAEGAEGWSQMTDDIAEANTVAEVSAARTNTLKGAWEAFNGMVETFTITAGEYLLPVLSEVTRWGSEMISEHGPQVAAIFGTIAEAVLPFVRYLMSAIETGDLLNDFLLELPGPIQAVAMWFGERLPLAMETLREIFTVKLAPVWDMWSTMITEVTIPVLKQLWDWIGLLLPIAIKIVTDYYEEYLVPMWESMQREWEETVKPALSELWDWLQVRVPQAIAWLSKAWDDIGKPMFRFIGWILSEYIIPIMARVVVWLAKNIPLAIDTVVKWWNEVFWPTMQEVWGWITGTLFPMFTDLYEWLKTKITEAITVLTDYWENTLLPAITAVWAFMDEYIFPLFTSVIELFEVIFVKAIEILSAAWENVLLPAITSAWEFISEKLQPVLDILLEFWEEKLQPALEDVAAVIKDVLLEAWGSLVSSWEKLEVLDKVKKAFNDIKDALEKAKTWVDKVKRAIENVSIPWWLRGHSPPPMADWFTYIADAASSLANTALPQVSAALDVAMPSASILGSTGPSHYREGDQYKIEAHYANQDEKTLREDVRFMQLRAQAAGG
jgi:hypothetical protein